MFDDLFIHAMSFVSRPTPRVAAWLSSLGPTTIIELFQHMTESRDYIVENYGVWKAEAREGLFFLSISDV